MFFQCKNYLKNQTSFSRVIITNVLPHFLWVTVYYHQCYQYTINVSAHSMKMFELVHKAAKSTQYGAHNSLLNIDAVPDVNNNHFTAITQSTHVSHVNSKCQVSNKQFLLSRFLDNISLTFGQFLDKWQILTFPGLSDKQSPAPNCALASVCCTNLLDTSAPSILEQQPRYPYLGHASQNKQGLSPAQTV